LLPRAAAAASLVLLLACTALPFLQQLFATLPREQAVLHWLFRLLLLILHCPVALQHVIYETHVGSFTPEGTLRAAIAKLPACAAATAATAAAVPAALQMETMICMWVPCLPCLLLLLLLLLLCSTSFMRMHVGSFTPGGTLCAVIANLPSAAAAIMSLLLPFGLAAYHARDACWLLLP
jgi:hypothetical protein